MKVLPQSRANLESTIGKQAQKSDKVKLLSDKIFSEIDFDSVNKTSNNGSNTDVNEHEDKAPVQDAKPPRNEMVENIMDGVEGYVKQHQETANNNVQTRLAEENRKKQSEKTKSSTSVWLPDAVTELLMFINARQFKHSKIKIGLSELCLFAVKHLDQLPDEKVAEIMLELSTDQRRNKKTK